MARLKVNKKSVLTTVVVNGPAELYEGQTGQFTATGLDQRERPMPVVVEDWTSSDPTIATIDAAGLATAHIEGEVDIVVRAAGQTFA